MKMHVEDFILILIGLLSVVGMIVGHLSVDSDTWEPVNGQCYIHLETTKYLFTPDQTALTTFCKE